mmetsp:Transcript_18239/g.26543  ORF Transcript_18239/g.26543 Transcript_18239/m.26543 type:complete len:330 (-) Transcript_18239:294-1283(-)
MTLVCDHINLPVASMYGESTANAMRLVALLLSGSLICSWVNDKRFRQFPLLFFNWISSFTYVLSQQIMSLLAINCVGLHGLIYFLKFMELFSVNCIATSSLVIFNNVFKILKNYHKNRRFRSYPQNRLILYAILISIGMTMTSACYWDRLIMTNGYFWVSSQYPKYERWISFSFTSVQSVVGIIMLVMLACSIPFSKSIATCVKRSHRTRIFLLLSSFAFLCNVYNGFSFILDQTESLEPGHSRIFTMIGWMFRFVQICLDSFVTGSVLNTAERNSLSVAFKSRGALTYASGQHLPPHPSQPSARAQVYPQPKASKSTVPTAHQYSGSL